MNPYTRPIKNLPPGVTGHLEIRDILPKRDWRDTAIGWAALFGAAYLALPALFVHRLPESAIAFGLLIYVAAAAGQLRVFTPIDQCSVRAVIDPMKPAERSPDGPPATVEKMLADSLTDERVSPDSNGKVVNGC
jgi:hypothetical protein